jgi:hypothetical protein
MIGMLRMLLTNCEIQVDSEQLPPLVEDDDYYWKDLMGCQVVTTTGYELGKSRRYDGNRFKRRDGRESKPERCVRHQGAVGPVSSMGR